MYNLYQYTYIIYYIIYYICLLKMSARQTPSAVIYAIEDFIYYLQKELIRFNDLVNFLTFIKDNKEDIKYNKVLCKQISSILPLTLYLCEDSSSDEINNYKKNHNQCLGICYENEDDEDDEDDAHDAHDNNDEDYEDYEDYEDNY